MTRNYFPVLLTLLIIFLSQILIIFELKTVFLKELFITVLFLIIAIMAVTGLLRERSWANSLALLLFFLIIINSVYLIFHIKSALLIVIVAFAIAGFLLSKEEYAAEDKFDLEEKSKALKKQLSESEKQKVIVKPYGEKKIKKRAKKGKKK